MYRSPDPKVTVFREVQYLNYVSPIETTESGMSTVARELHS